MIVQSLDLLLSHFQEPVWPRTVSTKATEGRQILVNSREEAIAKFEAANWLDCRISAYPPNAMENPSAVERFQGLNTITPRNIIVIIDLDKCNFKTDRALEMTLTKTLNNIREIFDVSPTVIWSGNGYHVYLVLDSEGIVLENIKQLTDLNVEQQQISVKFLRFVERFLSDGKSDRAHNTTVSFNNSMMRVPGSINSKNNTQVRIIQKWDRNTADTANPALSPSNSIKPLLRDFRRYLIDQTLTKKQKPKSKYIGDDNSNKEIIWIERLLQTPLADYRKYCIWRILTPYLLNKRKLTPNESTAIIREWLERCSQLKRLDFNVIQRINDGLDGASEGYMPIGFEKLKEENSELYQSLEIN